MSVTLADILSCRRPDHLAKARQVAMTLTRQLNLYSLQEIGTYFNGRDHSTVIHAVKKFPQIAADPRYASLVQRIRIQISTPLEISKTSVHPSDFEAKFLKPITSTFSGYHPATAP